MEMNMKKDKKFQT